MRWKKDRLLTDFPIGFPTRCNKIWLNRSGTRQMLPQMLEPERWYRNLNGMFCTQWSIGLKHLLLRHQLFLDLDLGMLRDVSLSNAVDPDTSEELQEACEPIERPISWSFEMEKRSKIHSLFSHCYGVSAQLSYVVFTSNVLYSLYLFLCVLDVAHRFPLAYFFTASPQIFQKFEVNQFQLGKAAREDTLEDILGCYSQLYPRKKHGE